MILLNVFHKLPTFEIQELSHENEDFLRKIRTFCIIGPNPRKAKEP